GDDRPCPTHATGGGDPSAQRRRQRAATPRPTRPAAGGDSDPVGRAREAGPAVRGPLAAVAGCTRDAERAAPVAQPPEPATAVRRRPLAWADDSAGPSGGASRKVTAVAVISQRSRFLPSWPVNWL